MTYHLNSFFTNELRQGVRRQIAGGSVYGRQRRAAQAAKARQPRPTQPEPSRFVPPAQPDPEREPRKPIILPVLRAIARVTYVVVDFLARLLVHLARETYCFARAYRQPPTREARQLVRFAERVAEARHEAHMARFQLQDGEEPF